MPGPVQRALALIVAPGQLCCAYQSKLLLPKLKALMQHLSRHQKSMLQGGMHVLKRHAEVNCNKSK